jgi:hypothetical protein
VENDHYACGLRDDPKLAGERSLDVAVGAVVAHVSVRLQPQK